MIEQKKIIAKRYAEAFFKAIQATENFEEYFKDFEAFTALYFDYKDLAEILNHPTIHVEHKIDMLHRIFGSCTSHLVVDFISLLVKKKRIALFELIAQEIKRMYRRLHGIRGIIIKSAVPLHDDERIRLKAVLAQKFGRIEIRELVDPSILAGLIIQFTDQVVDLSIRNRIKQLHELMMRVDQEWLASLISQPTLAL